ncbi:hypothetical protein XCR1_1150028 [Xenorhabdus cabanillasii JM26]|uniref:Uncharacterized protein n=1 Tax=Xenorhabdus cabanillasii JM26 TaxID=1427517 RepID=W1IPF4_9GAMM|nr:hypothetical protein XCR1_1150028 [Xenorhabdus cabanillasii JM26]
MLRIVFYQVECGLFVTQMEDFVYNGETIQWYDMRLCIKYIIYFKGFSGKIKAKDKN